MWGGGLFSSMTDKYSVALKVQESIYTPLETECIVFESFEKMLTLQN